MEYMAASANVIRGLFSAMTDPQTISFGGGAPATEALPVEEIHALANEVLTREARGCEALQYGPPAELKQLRELVANKLLAPKGVAARADDIIIVNGGLETMNLLCQVFINPGDIDTTELLKEANAAKVSYVAGAGFFVGNTGEGKNCMRISFGNVPPEKVETGMKRLGDLIKRKL